LRSLVLAVIAASLLTVGCKPSAKSVEPSSYPTGVWMFHALNGDVGPGPLLRFEGGAFWLEGCGFATGTVLSAADSRLLLVGEASACGEKEQALQDQLLALFSATPRMGSPAADVCGDTRGLEIWSKGQRAVFCELPHPE
jgi:hypothetical protein